MKNNWQKTTLGNVMEVIGGGTPKTSVAEYWNGEIPWLSVVDFNDDSRWVSKTEKTITEEGLKNSSTKLLNAGDIIISARGTVGAVAQLKKTMAFNQSCYGLRAIKDKTENDFLYFLVKYSLNQIKKRVHGAVFDTITKQTFDEIEILLPPLQIQRTIAGMLSSFDDKIELLREENKTLENIAQTIFKEWFVKDENNLPEGWRVGKLGDEFEIVMGQSPLGETYNEKGDGMIFFQGRAEFQERFPKVRLYTTEPKRFAEKFDVLVSVRAPVGDINVAFDKCCIGRGVGAVRSDKKSYALYKIKSLKDDFDKFDADGTVFGSINKDGFSNIKVIIPPNNVVRYFEKIVGPIDQKIFNAYLQIQTLSKLRDNLLPKLMTDEVQFN